jgi:phage tail-like protein
MPGRDPGNDFVAARFSLTIDGVEIAQFAELVGMVSEADPDSLTERLLKKLPGRHKPPTLTLRRGMSKDLGISAWHESVVGADPATARKNAALVVFNTAGTAIAKFELANAWPSKIEISALKAGSSEVLYETVTLVCDSARRLAV